MDINVNYTETNRDTLDKAIQECPDIAYQAMMVYCEDMIHRDKNENESETNRYNLVYVI